MTEPLPAHPLRLADLPARAATEVVLEPDAPARAAIARAMGIDALRKMRFAARLAPSGARDWTLTADLGATVVQPCVVTLAPVTTRIDERVLRHFARDWQAPEGGSETEMPEDDATEPLPEVLDLYAVAIEALALALPDWPRAEGAGPGDAVYAPPGVAPMTDEDARPFAGLAALKARLAPEEDGDGAPDPATDGPDGEK